MYQHLATPDEGGRVSTSTLHRIHATLMSALNTAVRRGLIDRNLPTLALRESGDPALAGARGGCQNSF
jgi:hypothetical protein